MASPETQAQWGLLFSCGGQSCGVNPVRDEGSSGLNSESSSLPPSGTQSFDFSNLSPMRVHAAFGMQLVGSG
jgi:hypothetical protein